MSTQDPQLRSDIEKALNRLRALRDETRVKVHLAGMDARSSWDRLEPRVQEAERAAEHASRAALEAIEAAAKKVSDLLARL